MGGYRGSPAPRIGVKWSEISIRPFRFLADCVLGTELFSVPHGWDSRDRRGVWIDGRDRHAASGTSIDWRLCSGLSGRGGLRRRHHKTSGT